MVRISKTTFVFLLLILANGLNTVAADDDLASFVRRAVRVLDSPELSQRQAAEKALIEKGPHILDLLPAESTQLSAESQKRVGRIRQTLYSQIANKTTQATTVTLKGNFSITSVLQQIKMQTNNQVVLQNPQATRLDVDMEQLLFYQALDQVLDAAKLTVEPYQAPHPNQILILPREEASGSRSKHVDYSGVFRIAATRITSTRSLQSATAQRCSLTLQIGWEPRLRPLYLTLHGNSISASDNTQAKINCLLNGQRTLGVEGTAPLVEIEIPLELPAPAATKLTSVTGTLLAMIPGRHEAFRFSKLNAASTFPRQEQRAGVIVGLEQVKRRGTETGVQVKLHYDDAGDAFASHRGWVNRNLAYLSLHGKPLDLTPRRETVDQNAQSITYIFWFTTDADLAQLQFHYHTPALLLHKQIEFQLHDIPLP